jgi:hypothetical protein
MIKLKPFFWLITIVFLLQTACGPTYIRSVLLTETKLDPETDGIMIGVIELENSPAPQDANSDFNPEEIYKIYRESLNKALKRYGIAYEPGKNKIITNITILGYKEGDAFIRWLAPGAGASRIQAQATLEVDGQIIGGVESQQTIAWGGGFSIGGWRKVIRWAAYDVGSKFCQEAFRKHSSTNCVVLRLP